MIDGKRARVHYEGQSRQCPRCLSSHDCPGKGDAKECEDQGGEKVSFDEYWSKVSTLSISRPFIPTVEEFNEIRINGFKDSDPESICEWLADHDVEVDIDIIVEGDVKGRFVINSNDTALYETIFKNCQGKKYNGKRVYFYPFITNTPNKVPNPPPIPNLVFNTEPRSIKKAPRQNLMKLIELFDRGESLNGTDEYGVQYVIDDSEYMKDDEEDMDDDESDEDDDEQDNDEAGDNELDDENPRNKENSEDDNKKPADRPTNQPTDPTKPADQQTQSAAAAATATHVSVDNSPPGSKVLLPKHLRRDKQKEIVTPLRIKLPAKRKQNAISPLQSYQQESDADLGNRRKVDENLSLQNNEGQERGENLTREKKKQRTKQELQGNQSEAVIGQKKASSGDVLGAGNRNTRSRR